MTVPISIVDADVKSGAKKFDGITITGEAKNLNWEGLSFENMVFSHISFLGSNKLSGVTFKHCLFLNIYVAPDSEINISNMQMNASSVLGIFLNKGAKLSCRNAFILGGGVSGLRAEDAYIGLTDSRLNLFGMGNDIRIGKANFKGTELRHSVISREVLNRMDTSGAFITKVKFEGYDRVRVL